jgi:hypothetical protein
MSRFHYDDWDGEGAPPEFYQQAAKNALQGRRGQIVLRELREALLALPQPRLIEGAFTREGEVCALGALAGHRFEKGSPLAWGNELIASLPQLEARLGEDLEDEWITLDLGEAMGLKRSLAWAIAYENDEAYWHTETPEGRYSRILRWVESNLSGEAVSS